MSSYSYQDMQYFRKNGSTLSVGKYISELTNAQFAEVCKLREDPVYQWLAEPGPDSKNGGIKDFAKKCHEVGIPSDFTNYPSSLHQLVLAIERRRTSRH